ncbi:MAG: hypothetical protein JXA13_03925 [Anaerolineales bacterium]|nr:hypothetical protein [Anaerolineales bacterium]
MALAPLSDRSDRQAAPVLFPKYSFPPQLLAGCLRDLLVGRPRSFQADANRCIARLNPPLQIFGKDNLPARGPCVLTVNHYARRGFGAWWLALAIASCLPVEMHWTVTAEWTFPGRWFAPLGRRLSRLVIGRGAQLYGFTPMPPFPEDLAARAAAVRRVLGLLQKDPHFILGLAPEGGDSCDGNLSWPPVGVGRFGLLLGAGGARFIPVGGYEEDGILCLNFGPAYELTVPEGLPTEEKDRQAACTMMKNIASLLPERLQGAFA